MKILNRITASLLASIMLISAFGEITVFAQEDAQKSISNNYMTFSINEKTGFFNIKTLEGHPQKAKDNNMDLLYAGDSIETSFTTVRLDGENYIFGQDYGLFNIDAKPGETTVDAVNNAISTVWTIKGVEITQTAYLSRTDNTMGTGNVSLEYSVDNKTDKPHDVGIRVMFDNSLGVIDAPVTMVETEMAPVSKESEFFRNGREPGDYIRYVDNYDTPAKEAFFMFDDVLTDKPDRMIVGHWYNLASTKWDYSHDANMAFSSGFNDYAVADTATALYWNDQTVKANEAFSKTLLYGVGDFSVGATEGNFNISLEIDDTGLVLDKNGEYKDDTVDAKITIYNNVDGSVDLTAPTLKLACDDGAFIVYEETSTDLTGFQNITKPLGFIEAGSIATYDFEIAVKVPEKLTSISVLAEITGNTVDNKSSAKQFILAQAPTQEKPQFAVKDVGQKKFHITGNRILLLSGIFNQELLQDRTKWAVALVSKTDPSLRYEVPHSNINITAEDTMSVRYAGDMVVGKYDIEFAFFDDYTPLFGNKYIYSCIEVVDDESLIMSQASYLGVVRRGRGAEADYEILEFYNRSDADKQAQQIAATYTDELVLLLEGEFDIDLDARGIPQGYTSQGDVTINDVLVGETGSRLEKFGNVSATGVRFTGPNNAYSASKKNVIFDADWKIEFYDGFQHSLTDKSIKIEVVGFVGVVMNVTMGFVNLQAGVLGKDAKRGYTISYSGSLNLLGYDPQAKEDPVAKKGYGRTGMGVNLSCAVDNVLFDKNGFVGIDTTVKAAFTATNILGCAQYDAYALELGIDTIKKSYDFKGTINFKKKLTLNIGGGLKEMELGNGESMVLPNSFIINFAVAPTSAAPFIPAVFEMYMLGINLTDMLALVDDYSQANTAEERRLMVNQATTDIAVSVGFVLFEMVLLNGTGTFGTNHVNLIVNGSVLVLPGATFDVRLMSNWKTAVHDLSGKVISPEQVNIVFKGDVNFIDIFKGGLSYSHSYIDIPGESSYGKQNTDVFSLYGGLYIPKMIPVLGGIEVFGATGTISDPGVVVMGTILGNDIGFSYAWGETLVWLYSDEEQEAQMNVNNMRYMTVKEPEFTLMSAGSNYVSGIIEGDSGYTSLICINYQGTAPSISELEFTIDGNPYELIAADGNYQNGNCFVIPDTGEGGKILIGQTNPPTGEHTYTLTAPSDIRLVNMEALNFTKVAKPTAVVPNGDGTVTVKADGNLNGSNIELYYISDKEAYDSILTEEYTDEDGNEKVRVYKEINGEKVELDEEFYATFAEHSLAEVAVDTDTAQAVLTPQIPAGAKSGEYYLMALVRSPYGKLMRCATEEAITYVNENQPESIKGAKIVDAGNGAIRIDVEDADTVDYTGYFVSLYNETDSKYEIETRYYDKDADILIETPIVLPGKSYSAEVVSVNAYAEDAFAEGADPITTQSATVREPEKVDINFVIENETKEGTYTDINGNEYTLPYVTGTEVSLKATTEEAVTGRFIIDTKEGEWNEEMATEFTHTVSDLTAGKHTIYFEARKANGDITLSEPLIFAVASGEPSVLLENGAVTIENGTVTVKGNAYSAQKIVFMDKEYALSEDGSFEFTVDVQTDRFATIYPLKAIGFDGSETSISVVIVNPDITPIDSIVMKADGEDVDSITLKPGDTVKITAVGSAEGEERDMGEDIAITVHDGNNLVTLDSEKNLTALSSGTAFVKATYDFGTRIEGENSYNYVFEDILKVNIMSQLSKPVPSIPDGASIKTSKKLEITGNGDVYYTLDGTDPTMESALYEKPITLPEGTVTVKAKTVKEGYLDSETATWTYSVKKASSGGGSGSSGSVKDETPDEQETAGITTTYENQTVDYGYMLELDAENGTIYYTTDGTTPNNESIKYEGPVKITEDTLIRAVVWTEGNVYSNVYEYDIKLNGYDIYLKENMLKGTLFSGYPDGTFRPDNAITRAETATVFRNATEMYGYQVDENRFPDVEMWAKDSINELAAAEVISGYPDGTFRPDNQVTRAEFVTMLMRIIDAEGEGTNYTDTQGHWAEKYIAKANEYGYISGYEDGSFRPDAYITRAEANVIMSKVFLFDANGTETPFTDVSPDHWAFGYIAN